MADERLLVKADRACAMLSIGQTSLRRLVAEGRIRVVYVGRATLYPVDALRAFANGCETFGSSLAS